MLWGCIFGPSQKCDWWQKLNQLKYTSLQDGGTEPQVLILILPPLWHWIFSCLNVNIHYIHCCLDSQKRNLCNNESAQLWYCFWPYTLRHRVGGPKEKLNPNNMGGAIFCSAEWKWRKNTILQFKFFLIRLFHGSATSPRTETISWELNDTGWKLCFGLCVKLWEQPQFSKTMRLWDKFQKPFSGHWGLSMLKRNLAFIAFSNCALLSKIAF